MIPAHVLLACMLTSSLDVATLKKSTEIVSLKKSVSFSEECKKDAVKKDRPTFLEPFKAGYIQRTKDEERVKLAPREKLDFKRRRCHQNINFNGTNMKPFRNKNKLRACGRK